ncbi:MAG: hypothetical protein ACM3S3_11295, partial [Candidatus Doudnabacteria bacterium]
CSSDNGSSTPAPGPAVGPSYAHGDFQGALALQLIQVFSPVEWSGQTDGPVLVSADKLVALSDDQKTALRMVLSEGYAVLVSEVTAEHLERLHAMNNSVPAISLDPNDRAALYVLTRPQGMTHVLVVKSAPDSLDPAEVEANKAYAQQVAQWFLERRRLHASSNALPRALVGEPVPPDPAILSAGDDNLPYLVNQLFTMRAYYSDECTGVRFCDLLGSATLSSWAVHNPKAREFAGQPIDYMITRLTGTFNTNGCKLSIGNNNRFAGYWLREAVMSANVADVTAGGYRLPLGAYIYEQTYEPKALNPTETRQSGVTFTMGGGGTLSAGATQKGPSVSGSVSFNAGVSYTNTSTVGPFTAVAANPTIGADATNRSKVTWTWDSWNFVKNHIKPANHACGGPGLKVADALPSEIYGSALSPKQEWVWALNREIRDNLPIQNDDYAYLPVEFNASMLLGWAFFPPWPRATCTEPAAIASFRMGDPQGFFDIYGVVGKTTVPPAAGAASVGLDAGGNVSYVTSHSNGLAFDPGCGTVVNFGTIPLGDPASYAHDGSNKGPPFSFGNIRANVPLAPDPYLMELTSVTAGGVTCTANDAACTLSGTQGTAVRLRGKSLHTATSVSFGGEAPFNQSINWETDPANPNRRVAYLTVTAPARVLAKEVPVEISLANPVIISPDPDGTIKFRFLYTE